MRDLRFRAAVLTGVGVVAASAAVLLSGAGGRTFQTAYTDLMQLFVAVAACLSAARCARTRTGRARAAWLLLALASGSWAVGEAVWTWYELRLGDQTPFPSMADVGFLGFPLAAGAAMLVWPTPGTGVDRKRRILDAAITTSALILISWQTVLSAVLEAGGSTLELAVSLAYPAGDVLLLVLVILTLNKAGSRTTLILAAAGMASLALADSAFVYLAATETYAAGVIDLGWIAGFVLLALAPLYEPPPAASATPADAVHVPGASTYPYVPVAIAGSVTLGCALANRPPNTGQLTMATAIVLLLLLRQYLTLRENALLTRELAAREAELRHLAFHDPLTGLANRALFHDRLGHALDLHARDLRPISLIFLDLDDFKLVNDRLGHAAGDELLIRVAERLKMSVRTGDTVARLGGDEFAVLLEDDGDASVVAHNVTAALRQAFTVQGSPLSVGASMGLVHLPATTSATTADVLLTQADTAMYAAKRSGKDHVEIYTDRHQHLHQCCGQRGRQCER